MAPGVSGDVGLEDRDRRDAEPVGGRNALGAEKEGRRGVEHVRCEAGEDALHVRVRKADGKLAVRERGHGVHGEAGVFAGRTGIRADHDRFVPGRGEVVEHLAHAVRHSVDGGEETLADDRDAHNATLTTGCCALVNGQ